MISDQKEDTSYSQLLEVSRGQLDAAILDSRQTRLDLLGLESVLVAPFSCGLLTFCCSE